MKDESDLFKFRTTRFVNVMYVLQIYLLVAVSAENGSMACGRVWEFAQSAACSVGCVRLRTRHVADT